MATETMVFSRRAPVVGSDGTQGEEAVGREV